MCSPFFCCTSYVTVIPESKANPATGDEFPERSQMQTVNSGEAAESPAGFAAQRKKLIPALLFTEFGDVRRVMPAVPRIQKEQPIHILQAGFGMAERPGVLLRRDTSQQTNPAVVEGFEKFERDLDRRVLRIFQPGPVGLLVRPDGDRKSTRLNS